MANRRESRKLPETVLWEHVAHPDSDVFCMIDKQGIIAYIHPNCEKLLGFPPEALEGQSMYQFVYGPDLYRTKVLAQSIISGKQYAAFQNTLRTRNGRLLNVSYFFHWNPEDQVCYLLLRENNAPDTVAQLLEQHRSEISNILDNIQEGFFAVAPDWRITHWNYLTEKLAGVSSPEAIGKNLWEIFPEAADKKSFFMLDQAMRTQQPQHFQAYYNELGLFADISVNPSPTGLSIFYRDITQQKKWEKEMQTFLLIIQKASNLIMVLDEKGLLSWANDAFWERTGQNPLESIGTNGIRLLQGPNTNRRDLNQLRSQVQQSRAYRGELQLMTREGKPLWVDVSCQPVYSNKGKLLKFIAIATDITEKKSLENLLTEERLKRQQQITRAAIKAQEEERSQVGLELHDDINQVLTTVKLYLELSVSGVPNALQLQQRSIELLQKSISGIRNISKRLSAPTLGKISLADSITELVKSSGLSETIQVKLDTSGITKGGFSSDLHLAVYRIVQEQITNIIRHAKARKMTIRIWTEPGTLHLVIEDDGIGFSAGRPKKGLGIRNMQSRAESLGGKLVLKSELGKGVIVHGEFPLK